MESTVEISLYPLRAEYMEGVLGFLDRLERAGDIEYSTNGMSTRLHGETPRLFAFLAEEFERAQEDGTTVLVLKAGPGRWDYRGKHHHDPG